VGVLDLFSKRQRQQRGEVPDVYTYAELPSKLRVQVVHILRDALPMEHAQGWYREAHDMIAREVGAFSLGKG
jgi:hypothetical protein